MQGPGCGFALSPTVMVTSPWVLESSRFASVSGSSNSRNSCSRSCSSSSSTWPCSISHTWSTPAPRHAAALCWCTQRSTGARSKDKERGRQQRSPASEPEAPCRRSQSSTADPNPCVLGPVISWLMGSHIVKTKQHIFRQGYDSKAFCRQRVCAVSLHC